MKRLALLILLSSSALSLISCGGSAGSNFSAGGSGAAAVPLTVSVQDTPPTGVAITSFEVQITSASIHNSATNADVALLANPTEVELEHLQSEPALLRALNVPAGTYSSATATFANPQMVIFNNTTAPITVGTTVCAVNASCKLTPTLSPATITVSTTPFPLTLAANSPLGFLLHFDVNSSVSSDLLTITPTINFQQIFPSASGVIHPEHLVGTITAISSPDFSLQPGLGGPMPVSASLPPVANIVTNGSTVYHFADKLAASPCTTANFACLAVGQTVNVTLNVLSDGSLLATAVTLFEQNSPAIEGTVVSVAPTKNQFQITMMGGQWMPGAGINANATVGAAVTVNVTSSTAYQIDLDGITLPSGLTFASINDVTVGQVVEVQPGALASPAANTLTLTTNQVRLDESQVTATVKTTSPAGTPPSFVLNSLPSLYPTGSTMNVLTVPTTFFSSNITGGVAGLAAGNTVSVGGLLFNSTSGPTMVGEIVVKRVPCTATWGTGTATTVPCVM